MRVFESLKSRFTRVRKAQVTSVADLDPFAYAGQSTYSGWQNSIYDGGKYSGGFGDTQVQTIDYWTLRARSSQLFNENLYARGLIRRLVTNEINTGLCPESIPDEQVLGLAEDALTDWSESVENRFNLWAKSPRACDWARSSTFGEIQRAARREALVNGDVLVVLRFTTGTRTPSVQLIRGDAVVTPLSERDTRSLRKGHEIVHGVEVDASGRQAAYWVRQKDGGFKRLPAYGEKSGRRLAWLVYGTDKRLDDVRGQPLLSLVLQSLKEVDRYRDSAQRKAVVNSILAMFIKKSSDKMGTLPITGGAVRRGTTTVSDDTTAGVPRKFNIASHIPGLVIEELQEGEEPVLKGGEGTDTNFATFEEAVIQAVAWANEIPPEILRLSFSNNYSASQAAINEFKIYLNRVWAEFGETFCTPVFEEWLVSETLNGKIDATGLLESWRDSSMYDKYAAWTMTEWYGSIKPSTDMLKQTKGSKMLVEEGWSTNARESRVITGTKYSKNVKRLKRENQMKADALRPLLELRDEFSSVSNSLEDDPTAQALVDQIGEDLDVQLDEALSRLLAADG